MPSNEKKKILFVSHKTNMSGAPLLLLQIIKAFKKQSDIPFEILLMEDGALANEFRKLATTYVWRKPVIKATTGIFALPVGLFLRAQQVVNAASILIRLKKFSTVFFNTISNGHIHKKLLFLNCRFVSYVHEMDAAIHITTSPQSLQVVLKNTGLFIACSNAVKNNLVLNHAITPKNIKVFATSMEVTCRKKEVYANFIRSFKSTHSIPEKSVIIGVCATNEWRKGFGFFLPLIAIYFSQFADSNVFFVWKGFRREALSSFFDLNDLTKSTYNKKMLLLPHGNDSIETIACFDIHLLLAREDPYPLVVLEAASFSIPTVCFLNAGGTSEFVEEDSGFCVPYGDLLQTASSLHQLAVNDGLREQMGIAAQQKVKARHAQEIAMPAFIELLKDEL